MDRECDIQLSFLPKRAPEIPGFDLAGTWWAVGALAVVGGRVAHDRLGLG